MIYQKLKNGLNMLQSWKMKSEGYGNGLLWSFVLTSLSSCSLFSPPTNNQMTQYVLEAQPLNIKHSVQARTKTLLVLTTQVSPPYDSNQIVYMNHSHQIGYYAKHQWAATVSQMITPLIAESMRKSQRYRAIVMTPFAGNVDERLSTQILKFQQEFFEDVSVFHLVVSAQLTNSLTNRIDASQQWDIKIPAPSNNPEGGVVAANRAVSMLITKLINFS